MTAGISYHDDHLIEGSVHPLLFGGKPDVEIPAGSAAVSDPVDWDVPSDSLLAVSFYVQHFHGWITFHRSSYEISYTNEGKVSDSAQWKNAKKIPSWYFVSGIDVLTPHSHPVVVAIGDSITEGACSVPNAEHRWSDILTARLNENASTRDFVVLNEGIGGNRVVKDSAGPSLLARLDRDVLSQSGVRTVILLEGINDIGRTVIPRQTGDAVTADEIIAGYQTVLDKLHRKHIRVIGATVTPFKGAFYFSEDGEKMRQKLNAWIRAKGHFDAVADFDMAARDPKLPDHIAARYDCGDHLHPNDDGYRVLGRSIDLRLLAPSGK
ncbi:MAG TPA: SGNH/GDSL hydrolase family protein [Acidobacteriaceae bacterium]